MFILYRKMIEKWKHGKVRRYGKFTGKGGKGVEKVFNMGWNGWQRKGGRKPMGEVEGPDKEITKAINTSIVTISSVSTHSTREHVMML